MGVAGAAGLVPVPVGRGLCVLAPFLLFWLTAAATWGFQLISFGPELQLVISKARKGDKWVGDISPVPFILVGLVSFYFCTARIAFP